MDYKIVGKNGVIPFEISKEKIDDCIKEHCWVENMQFTDYLFDESGHICGLKGSADLGRGYNFNNGYKELTIYFNETYSFTHEQTIIEGPSDWHRDGFEVTFQLIKSKHEFERKNMSQWEPTFGKWNDDENYTLYDETWKTALRFAEEYHVNANHSFMATKRNNNIICVREWEDIPYIDFIKKAMTILVHECHMTDEHILTVFALYGLLENTKCTSDEIIEDFGLDCADPLKVLYKNKNENFQEYIECINNNNENRWLLWIVLAIQLEELRLVFCPFESWKEDVEYYQKLEETLSFLENDECFGHIFEKIKIEIDKQKTFSKNYNKTTEELFTDWYEDSRDFR